MPDKTGKLSLEELKQISELINAKWLGRADECPICGDKNWTIQPHLVQPITLGPNHQPQFVGGGVGYPFVMMISPCGYSRFMNAVAIGFIKPTPPPPATPPQPATPETKIAEPERPKTPDSKT
jgi:hypothetical protein